MKAFTVYQPWASLIMIGAKPLEFRSKSFELYRPIRPAVGERVVIQASARTVKPAEVDDLIKRLESPDHKTGLVADLALQLLLRVRAAHKYRLLPLGAALGTVEMGRPRNAGVIFAGLPEDSDRGKFNWAWPMLEPRPFDAPIPLRGQQGFFEVPDNFQRAA